MYKKKKKKSQTKSCLINDVGNGKPCFILWFCSMQKLEVITKNEIWRKRNTWLLGKKLRIMSFEEQAATANYLVNLLQGGFSTVDKK